MAEVAQVLVDGVDDEVVLVQVQGGRVAAQGRHDLGKLGRAAEGEVLDVEVSDREAGRRPGSLDLAVGGPARRSARPTAGPLEEGRQPGDLEYPPHDARGASHDEGPPLLDASVVDAHQQPQPGSIHESQTRHIDDQAIATGRARTRERLAHPWSRRYIELAHHPQHRHTGAVGDLRLDAASRPRHRGRDPTVVVPDQARHA